MHWSIGKGEKFDSAVRQVKKSYEDNINDEFVVPALTKIKDEKKREDQN